MSLPMPLRRAALIVNADDPARLHRQVGDNEAHAGKQLTQMPYHLGDDTTGFVLGRCLTLKVAEDVAFDGVRD